MGRTEHAELNLLFLCFGGIGFDLGDVVVRYDDFQHDDDDSDGVWEVIDHCLVTMDV